MCMHVGHHLRNKIANALANYDMLSYEFVWCDEPHPFILMHYNSDIVGLPQFRFSNFFFVLLVFWEVLVYVPLILFFFFFNKLE